MAYLCVEIVNALSSVEMRVALIKPLYYPSVYCLSFISYIIPVSLFFFKSLGKHYESKG